MNTNLPNYKLKDLIYSKLSDNNFIEWKVKLKLTMDLDQVIWQLI